MYWTDKARCLSAAICCIKPALGCRLVERQTTVSNTHDDLCLQFFCSPCLVFSLKLMGGGTSAVKWTLPSYINQGTVHAVLSSPMIHCVLWMFWMVPVFLKNVYLNHGKTDRSLLFLLDFRQIRKMVVTCRCYYISYFFIIGRTY